MRVHLSCAVTLVLALGTAGCSSPGHGEEVVGEAVDPIVGGEVDYGHYYVVGVGDNFGAWCTGTLISRQTVVTAAHCAFGIERVFYGTNWETSTPADMEVLHPEWTGNVDSPDVALVRLSAPTDRQPAPLMRSTFDNTATYIGPDFEFVGYGATNGMSGQGGGTKRRVAFPITAVGPTTTLDNLPVPEEFVYYEHPSKNTCYGDSGGPMFYRAPTSGASSVEQHAAVTSWGDEFCTQYGVQARTDQPEIDQWIQATIDMFEGPDACSNDGVCEETCNTATEVLDPDCQADHCEADGLCAYACVEPLDPDCPEIFDPCAADGFCNDECVPADPDCPMTTTTLTSGPVTAVVSNAAATTSSGMSTAASTGSGAGGEGPSRAEPNARSADLYGRGCACRVDAPTSRRGGAGWWLLVLAGAAWARRRKLG